MVNLLFFHYSKGHILVSADGVLRPNFRENIWMSIRIEHAVTLKHSTQIIINQGEIKELKTIYGNLKPSFEHLYITTSQENK